MTADPLNLTQRLIRCPSITPNEAGTLALISDFLSARGFVIERFDCGSVSNFYARLGTTLPHLCFAGHVDVVPVGDTWSVDPFEGVVQNGKLYGRGVVDMKGAIGAFLAAVDGYDLHHGSLSILLTSDEEGVALNGIRHVVGLFEDRKEHIDACIVGEPTNVETVGDTVKIGRRGTLNASITVHGKAGHVAYPDLANNPIPALMTYLHALITIPLDEGMPLFDPSHVEVTSIDTGNPVPNVIPAQATAHFNIRFNPLHTADALMQKLHSRATHLRLTYTLTVRSSGEAFLCPNKTLQDLVCQAVKTVTGSTPSLSTSGGTSDARFLKDLCPVIEFGLVSQTAHQDDEHILVEEIYRLTSIYRCLIEHFFAVE
jgi:succinyl-diaminopimelate desuccinylase